MLGWARHETGNVADPDHHLLCQCCQRVKDRHTLLQDHAVPAKEAQIMKYALARLSKSKR